MPTSILTTAATGYITNALTGDNGAGAANSAAAAAANRQAAIGEQQQKIANENWESYKANFQPLEADLAQQVRDANAPSALDAAAGQAGADVTQQFSNQQAQIQRGLSRNGVSPSSGVSMALTQDANLRKAVAQAGAQTAARTNAKNRAFDLTKSAIVTGNGIADSASTGLSSAGSTYGSVVGNQTTLGNNASARNQAVAGIISPMVTTGINKTVDYFKNKKVNSDTESW